MKIKLVARFYYVFMLSNKDRNIFDVGITGDLSQEFKRWKELQKLAENSKCIHLVYFEKYEAAAVAVNRELEIRNLSQKKRRLLVKSFNAELIFLDEVAADEFEIIL